MICSYCMCIGFLSDLRATIWPLGQAVKTPPFHGGNRGSSPLGVTICGLVVQLVRMPACHAGGRGFKSLPGRQNADVAQLVEQLICNQQVAGSSPIISSKLKSILIYEDGF